MSPRKRLHGTTPFPPVSGEYIDMLRQYTRDNKRQRKLEESKTPSQVETTSEAMIASPSPSPQPLPLIPSKNNLAIESDSDFDSDEFENVELDSEDDQPQTEGVLVTMDQSQASHLARGKKQRGLPKTMRLLVHKLALCSWLVHARNRNKWLLDPNILSRPELKGVLPQSVFTELFPPDHLTPFLKSKQFIEGLRHALEVWQHRFRVVRPGLASNHEEKGDSGDHDEYITQLLALTGSVDLEGQGFVAMLRSIGLNTRLICSLQPPDNLGADTQGFTKSQSSNCPIFWAEVWDSHVKKWVAVDTVTSTVRLPTRSKIKLKLEPPQSDRLNVLRYCVALDSRNQVRDVTRRYSSNYNSRTRKKRLPHFESEEWLNKLWGVFAPNSFTQADKDELVELARYPKLEGIPTRVQDFVGHPEYALASHLRHNEVLKPGAQPSGILSAKTKTKSAAVKNPAYIYSRKDVLIARSSQSWYKRGRAIQVGAQPRSRRDHKNRLTGEIESVALYTEDQTELYVPQPVEPDGTVPKSQYRTIDIFCDSMIPEGGHYVRSKYGTQAAKALRIDFANVVTGVDFGKRGPQSRMFGIVVAKQFVPAIHAVITALQEQEIEELRRQEDFKILMLWRKFIMGIQIWERVEKMNPSMGSESQMLTSKDKVNVKTDPVDFELLSSESEVEPSSHQTQKKNESKEDSDVKVIDEKPKRSRIIMVNPNKFLAFAAPKNTTPPTKKISSDDKQLQSQIDGVNDASSPDSYNSFSDLDVDEISESEL